MDAGLSSAPLPTTQPRKSYASISLPARTSDNFDRRDLAFQTCICWMYMLIGGILLAEMNTNTVDSTMFCPECNAELNPKLGVCTKCGFILPSAPKVPSQPMPFTKTSTPQISGRNTAIAALLTWIFMPVGYWYVKRLKRGMVVFLATIIIAIVIGQTWVVGIMILVAIFDVYRLSRNKPAPFDFLNRWGL
jgi:hypothetical protein